MGPAAAVGDGEKLPGPGVAATSAAGMRLLGPLRAHAFWEGIPDWKDLRAESAPEVLVPSDGEDETQTMASWSDDWPS